MCQCDHENRFVCFGNRGGGGCHCLCHGRKKVSYQNRKKRQPETAKADRLLLGKRLVEIRAGYRDSQAKFVARIRLGVSAPVLGTWERGVCLPPPNRLKVICDRCEVSLSELLDGVDETIQKKYAQIGVS